ncbi:hypothetical protein BJF90_04195 [Pseudonocardia sp. CNS-004]|nr:hypothetical protein BJF90_04195 [Pseudonocardia sp. CNS-004]
MRVPQRGVATEPADRRHHVDGVAEDRHGAAHPAGHRRRSAERDGAAALRIGVGEGAAQARVPAGHDHVDHGAQGVWVELGNVGREQVAPGDERAQHVGPGTGGGRRFERGREQEARAARLHRVHARGQPAETGPGRVVEPDLVRDADDTRVDRGGVRQQLRSDPRGRPVRPHQQVGDRRAAVGEPRLDPAVAPLLVTDELGPESHDVVQAAGQHAAQRRTVGRVVVLGGVGPARIHDRFFDDDQLAELLGQEPEVATGARGREELLPAGRG